MGTFKDKGIVIKEYRAGENDKRLTLLLLERGRLNILAKGAGKPTSKYHASAQLFAFSEFIIYEGSGFYTLAQASLIESFYGVRDGFERLCLASHIIELADKMIMPDMDCKEEIELVYLALSRLSVNLSQEPRLVTSAFEFKFYQLEGFAPVVSSCTFCGKDIAGEAFFADYGTVCPDCSGTFIDRIRLSSAAVQSLKYILNTDIKNLFKFRLTGNAQKELFLAAEAFRNRILDSPPKSLDMLEDSQYKKEEE